MDSSNPLRFKIPSTKDHVIVQNLTSETGAAFNGKEGTIVRYVAAQGRYEVKIPDHEKSLSVKVGNLRVCEVGSKLRWIPGVHLHLLIPCHVETDIRLQRFEQCAKSVAMQSDKNIDVLLGISSPHQEMLDRILEIVVSHNADKPGVRWHAIFNNGPSKEEEDEGKESNSSTKAFCKTQFQHFQTLMEVSDEILSADNKWFMFLDKDDMFHPSRVNAFRERAYYCQKNGKILFGAEVSWFWIARLLVNGKRLPTRISFRRTAEKQVGRAEILPSMLSQCVVTQW